MMKAAVRGNGQIQYNSAYPQPDKPSTSTKSKVKGQVLVRVKVSLQL
jgi:hypothetical protein